MSNKPKSIMYLGTKEKWKRVYIHGEKTKYQVSNLGNVRNTERNNALLNFTEDKYGYTQVCLSHNGKKIVTTVHRLVAIAFIKNPKNKPQVNHINGLKYMNCVRNLEWVTGKENVIHSYATGLHDNVALGENHGQNKYREKDIELACKYLEEDKKTYKEITKLTGIPRTTLHDIVKKQYWTHISDKYNVENFTNQKYAVVSEELGKQIIKLAKKGYSSKKIRKTLELPYSDKLYSFIAYQVNKYGNCK